MRFLLCKKYALSWKSDLSQQAHDVVLKLLQRRFDVDTTLFGRQQRCAFAGFHSPGPKRGYGT